MIRRKLPLRALAVKAGALLASLTALVAFAPAAARADVRLPGLLSDGMVLQQRTPVRLWGWADEGEAITIRFQRQVVTTTARDGRWSILLEPLLPGGPFPLTIAAKNTIQYDNVLVGEVWVCSGQSNMEWSLSRSFEAEKHIAKATNPRIRLFSVPHVRAAAPQEDIKASWQFCTPETARDFSAVGYFFGRDLQHDVAVPIGLIDSSWGGTPAEAWTEEWAIVGNPALEPLLARYRQGRDNYRKALIAYPDQAARARAEGRPVPAAPRPPWKPAELFNGMIAPLLPYTIRGAIWYQGESNAGRAAEYRTLFPAMIQSWRDAFGQSDLPFLAVQLAPFGPGNNYAELREAQLMATTVLPNVGLAVITDVGEMNDIHPTKKEPVGQRLALLARKMVYGHDIVASGPLYRSLSMNGGKAILRFDNVGGGLEARGGPLKGFTIAGEDGRFVPAEAVIAGDTVVVSSPEVKKPVAVRYGWANYPDVNLWNKEGLPASPFRTDGPALNR